jgi:hypothetical protein
VLNDLKHDKKASLRVKINIKINLTSIKKKENAEKNDS